MRIAVVHPDLGLGGAERLIIDVALALKSKSHTPTIYSAYRDPARCFDDVIPGSERVPIRIISVPFPRSMFGRFHAILAALRCAYIALWICLQGKCDAALVDVVSLPVSIFALFSIPVVFYCHFPDKILEQSLRHQPKGILHRVYRKIVDGIEYYSLKQAARIVCNSQFTRDVFHQTYPSLSLPDIVYPCIAGCIERERISAISRIESSGFQDRDRCLFVSINRYERKKNLSLAIHAFQIVLQHTKSNASLPDVHLIIAGGFDPRIRENVEQYEHLEAMTVKYGLQERVTLRKNISDIERASLMSQAIAVVYTPSNEHFGIVPLESMQLGTPVLATNTGGPMETIADSKTGLLREPTPASFADGMLQFIRDPGTARGMGREGRIRVDNLFSERALADSFNDIFSHLKQDMNKRL